MRWATHILPDALRDVERVWARPAEWEELIRSAREAGVLGTLAYRLRERRLLDRVPAAPRAHLNSALIAWGAQRAAVRREVEHVARALRSVDTPTVLLKGAAYLLADLPPSRGRLFSDLDILVPRRVLPAVESALMLAGFATTHHHPYDQRYFREWMHELPPMQHVKRLTILDVHHTIVPPTSRVQLDASTLFRAAQVLSHSDGLSVLAPTDMVLHSATHLFHNEEFDRALRDLVDIDALLRHFGGEPRFFRALATRAADLNLGRPLYYALRWTSRLLATPVPDDVQAIVDTYGPAAPARALMDVVLENALRPTALRRSTRWARQAQYIRGHWLKMRMPLLAWHLTVKTFRRAAPQA